jgi:SNF2 family DNA or RNA helicase
MDFMTVVSIENIPIRVSWIETSGEAGQFLIWREGAPLDSLTDKQRLFGWHAPSFYGSTLEWAEAGGVKGIALPAAMALSYFATPSSVIHARFHWGVEAELLRQAAALFQDALQMGRFMPDHVRWLQEGRIGWKLALSEGRQVEWAMLQEQAMRLEVGYLPAWFDHLVAELAGGATAAREEAAGEAWADIAARTPLLPGQLGGAFELPEASGRLWANEDDWLVAIGWKQDDVPFRTMPQLVEPDEEANEWRLRVMLQDKANPDLSLTVDAGVALKLLKEGVGADALPGAPDRWRPWLASRLARDVDRWLQTVPALEDPDSPGALRGELSDREAWEFLNEHSLQLAEAGYPVLLPKWWEDIRRLKPKLKAKVRSSVGSSGHSMFGIDQLVQFDWRLAIGDAELTEEEFRQLEAQNRRLVQIRGRWVQLDPTAVEQIRTMMKQVQKKNGLSFRDVLELHLLGSGEAGADAAGFAGTEAAAGAARTGSAGTGMDEATGLDGGAAEVLDDAVIDVRLEIELNEHLADMVGQLQRTTSIPIVDPPDGFQGSLRKYQHEGLSWLAFLAQFGLGGCLADDMGLGKTIQWIAYLLHLKNSGMLTTPALLICPTSVLGNWQKELERFAPTLQVRMHYGSGRVRGEEFTPSVAGIDLVITSYTTALIDETELSTVEWSSLCLDEAQNIKNAYAKQSAAIRKLPARHRIALTGTPIENRLTELWSIFDFVNPGYLSSLNDFRKKYVTAIERTNDALLISQVQKLIKPFLLRRVKKDPAIQLDLPEKNEMKVYLPLTAEQGAMYESMTKDLFAKLDSLSLMERRGLILATLTRLKQLCDHPALLQKGTASKAGGQSPSTLTAEHSAIHGSNKISRLLEMIQELREEGDRCLIFTQFVEMGYLLQRTIEHELGENTQFLHGGVPKTGRDRMITRFQDRSLPKEKECGVFLLSLKAGGIGLNLTAANHVFHVDRWWNPAVESQATDRAYRIGQTRDVQVHKFISLGTLEERIDEMIERKQGLSDQIVGGGENWVTELSTGELRELFALRRSWLES